MSASGLMWCQTLFVDAAALLECLEGNSPALVDEEDAVLSSGLKGEIVNE